MAFSFKHAVNAAFLGLLFATSPGFAGDKPRQPREGMPRKRGAARPTLTARRGPSP